MDTYIDTTSIESAVFKANFSGLELLMTDDDFEVLDLLRSIKHLESSSPATSSGLDIIRALDNLPAEQTAYVLFKQMNIFFVLIKFGNSNDDGGLALFYSAKQSALIKLFKASAAILSNTEAIIRWLKN